MATKIMFSSNSYALADRDQYGGCTAIQFESTGFFRLEKADRWWLVTPEGNAYLSFGLNHVELDHLLHDYNRSHWAEQFGIAPDAEENAFRLGYEQKVRADFKALGATTLGTHSGTGWYGEPFANDVVNVRMVDICHYQTPTEEDFHDVFSDEFVQHCERRALDVAAPRKDDPRVLGYTLTDCPILTESESWPHIYNIYGWERAQAPTWPRVLRNRGEESAGKRAYVKTMRRIYSDDINALDKTYSTGFDSFDTLLRTSNWRFRPELDNQREQRAMKQFSPEMYDVATEILLKGSE